MYTLVIICIARENAKPLQYQSQKRGFERVAHQGSKREYKVEEIFNSCKYKQALAAG